MLRAAKRGQESEEEQFFFTGVLKQTGRRGPEPGGQGGDGGMGALFCFGM